MARQSRLYGQEIAYQLEFVVDSDSETVGLIFCIRPLYWSRVGIHIADIHSELCGCFDACRKYGHRNGNKLEITFHVFHNLMYLCKFAKNF